MRKLIWSLLLAAFALQMLWAVPADAQAGRGVITGTVKDSGGSILSSAELSAAR